VDLNRSESGAAHTDRLGIEIMARGYKQRRGCAAAGLPDGLLRARLS